MAGEPVEEQGQRPEATTSPDTRIVADDVPETDSVLDGSDSGSSYLSSLRSSIYNYRYESGRRYHAFREGTYLVPNDEEEQDRMDLCHQVYSLVLDGKLYLAPIGDNVQRVLDIGTGTGIWAIDFADVHPSAEVIGTDLSPIQPEWTPPNCAFEVDDFEDEWVYKQGFDLIHARELEGCIGDDNKLFSQIFTHLRPGGYVELQAVEARFGSDDDTLEKAKNCQLWMSTLVEACAKFGKPVDCAPKWKEKLEKAGFVDVQQDIRKIPIGPWPKDEKLKEVGRYQAVHELQVIDSYTPKLFSHVLGWDNTEIQVLMAHVKKELRDPTIHLYLPVYTIWGRKPEA